ncbi:integrase core domain-containing protein [Bradyrhizobium sp. SZCCHNR2028]|uniref:integrase core domain-containing protein n=1 Tax=Bradyrhizobium sp. SZCCHNR2028 TaxID=3057382 RepID=UPI0028EFF502|nr:integrase core domain-containing protein [Bradyrhizobium sp. SZCCHNR2028]
MPFRESSPVEQRIGLFREYDTGAFSVTELCARHGISRETFYVWERRRASGDPQWFEEKSHAVQNCPHATADRLARRIIATRRRFPHFGPKKIKAWLARERPEVDWPAASTIGDLLKREGLVEAQPRRLTDAASRYLIEVRIVDPTWAGVKGALERVFKDIGLPDAIRSDNGVPFGSTGAGGLSALSVWWLKLGIEPRYIPPASPQDNGRHERMHRTLKAETSKPPADTAAEQQRRFDAFRRHFNEERPHEALDQVAPVKLWRRPVRFMPDRLDDPWYDADHEVRRVRPTGDIKWQGEHVFVGEALAGELIGLAKHDTGGHIVRFWGRDLGLIDRDRRFLRFAPPRARLRVAQETAETTQQ